jgi:hypothetical protein
VGQLAGTDPASASEIAQVTAGTLTAIAAAIEGRRVRSHRRPSRSTAQPANRTATSLHRLAAWPTGVRVAIPRQPAG